MFNAGSSGSGTSKEEEGPCRDPDRGKAPMTESTMRKEVRERLCISDGPRTTAEVVAEEERKARE